MKILFVSWYFPPSNTIAAVRLGKLAKHLNDLGHSIQVLTVKDPPHPQTLPTEIEEARVHRAVWRDVNWFPLWVKNSLVALLRGGRAKKATIETSEGGGGASARPSADGGAPAIEGKARRIRRKLSRLYAQAVNFPDKRIGWLPAARRRGIAVARDWRPDGIFASGPPFTTLLLGYLVSRASGVPLVVEFRDRWSEDPYYPPPAWRKRWNQWLEDRIVAHSVGLTTVSEPWAVRFRERYIKPVAVIYNGFDEEDFKGIVAAGESGGSVLRIVYTGGIYPGYRDPSPLFQAIARSPRLRERVRVEFYGTKPDLVAALAEAHDVTGNVRVFDHVTHAEALKIQCGADALLLMQWDNPMEQGNIPGKFAEYLGARRPIIVLGYAEGVPATVVNERSAGIASTDPVALAEGLERWLDTKDASGSLPGLDDEAVAGFSRREQSAKLDAFLRSVFAGDRAAGG